MCYAILLRVYGNAERNCELEVKENFFLLEKPLAWTLD